MTPFYPLDPSGGQNFEILKIQNGGGRHGEKSQTPYLSNGLTDRYEIW